MGIVSAGLRTVRNIWTVDTSVLIVTSFRVSEIS